MKNNRLKAWAGRYYCDGHQWLARTEQFSKHWLPCEIVFNNGWIHVSERRPNRKRDGDTIIVWNPNADMVVVVDPQVVFAGDDVYWQSFPKAPKKIGKKGRK